MNKTQNHELTTYHTPKLIQRFRKTQWGMGQENQVHRENKAALLGHRTDVQGHPLELGEETQVLHTESVEVRCSRRFVIHTYLHPLSHSHRHILNAKLTVVQEWLAYPNLTDPTSMQIF